MSIAKFGIRDSGFGVKSIPHSALKTPNSELGQQGQMIIIACWVIGIITIAVGAISAWSIHELKLGSVPERLLKRAAVARAGVEQAIALLNMDENVSVDHMNDVWATGMDQNQQQHFENVSVGDGRFWVGLMDGEEFRPGIVDEERKLNINSAQESQLKLLIASLQVEGIDPQQIATTIIDWREASDPEGPICKDLSWKCHNGPFDSVDELLLVPGMTAEFFSSLKPYITVYGNGMVNANTASEKVLDAIGCEGKTIVEERQINGPFSSPPCNATSVSSSAFSIPVEARLNSLQSPLRFSAVVDRIGCALSSQENSRCILAWLLR